MNDNQKIDLPKRIKGKHFGSFKECSVDTNYYGVKLLTEINEIYIYKVIFTPFIPHDNIKQRLSLLEKAIQDIRSFIRINYFI